MKSNPGGAPYPAASPAEVVSEHDVVAAIYSRHAVTDVVERFGLSLPFSDTDPRSVTETDLDERFFDYAKDVSVLAVLNESLDVPLLRTAFDIVIDDMNRVANQKFGDGQPATIRRALLSRLGIPPPAERKSFAHHDDRFWNVQFVDGYREGGRPQRQPSETDTHYLGRYFGLTLHNFALAPFSYLPQAIRRS
jgi:hypothetical protein